MVPPIVLKNELLISTPLPKLGMVLVPELSVPMLLPSTRLWDESVIRTRDCLIPASWADRQVDS